VYECVIMCVNVYEYVIICVSIGSSVRACQYVCVREGGGG